MDTMLGLVKKPFCLVSSVPYWHLVACDESMKSAKYLINLTHFTVCAFTSKIFKNALEVKKSKCENHYKFGPIICKMIRVFQIWSQNSNQNS